MEINEKKIEYLINIFLRFDIWNYHFFVNFVIYKIKQLPFWKSIKYIIVWIKNSYPAQQII